MITQKELENVELSTYEENDSQEVPPSDIVAYNELRSCADLYRMYDQGLLEIQPEFQREIVWKGPAQTRFIDSLVKQLPIPSMCFSLDFRTQRWKVIDGLQRMDSIVRFLSAEDWRLSKLEDIDPKLSGAHVRRFHEPKSDLYPYYTRVQNLTLPITVLRCDYEKKAHNNYLFTIFHRLNSGGMRLNNQEIRNCIYIGSFNQMLKELNEYKPWMSLNRMRKTTGYRFTKQELILRILAFHYNATSYSGRLAKFLNDFMDDNREPGQERINEMRDLFFRTTDIVHRKIFDGKQPPKLPLSVLEATLLGVSFNLNALETASSHEVKAAYNRMREDDVFAPENLARDLSSTTRVKARISAAKNAFSL